MITTEINNIYNNGLSSIPKEGDAFLNMFKNAGPYIFAGALFKGLEQQVYVASAETVLSSVSWTLTGGYWICGAMAVFGMYKALDPHFTQLGYKKVQKVTITKEELQTLKNAIDRLTEENEALKTRAKCSPHVA